MICPYLFRYDISMSLTIEIRLILFNLCLCLIFLGLLNWQTNVNKYHLVVKDNCLNNNLFRGILRLAALKKSNIKFAGLQPSLLLNIEPNALFYFSENFQNR